MVTISFTVDDTTVARIAVAVGNRLSLLDVDGNPRPATNAEVKAFIIGYVKQQVRDAETSIERAKIAFTEIEAT